MTNQAMPNPEDELMNLASRMEVLTERGKEPEIQQPLARLQEAAERAAKAWSGSYLGYHANVYYAHLAPPPPGAHFSSEWGFIDTFSGGTVGDWVELDPSEVRAFIKESAGNPDMKAASSLLSELSTEFEASRMDVLSIVGPRKGEDQFLQQQWERLDKLAIKGQRALIQAMSPRGKFMSRDMTAMGQGFRTPPHVYVLVEALEVKLALDRAKDLTSIARQVARHTARHRQPMNRGNRMFVGHGQSNDWLELSSFLRDRLGLEVDEFNRIPVAGKSNKERLNEMLDSAAMAFVVMTGEDEKVDGSIQPRMNAIHEVGLFQGRLGFTRAIILLESGCSEFSNIEGLGQIRFPKGNISAAFEKVRHVLERENILTSTS